MAWNWILENKKVQDNYVLLELVIDRVRFNDTWVPRTFCVFHIGTLRLEVKSCKYIQNKNSFYTVLL